MMAVNLETTLSPNSTEDIPHSANAHGVDELTHISGAYELGFQSQEKFEKWILALRLRYWIEFGNQDQYQVRLLRKLNIQ